jgi:hypothetical protein
MKLLVISSHGRCGTTIVQTIWANKLNLNMLGEGIILDNGESEFKKSIGKLTMEKNWACKLFFDEYPSDLPKYNPTDIVELVNPDLIINSYRKDLLEQFLSWHISYNSTHWNSENKEKYKKFKIEDVEEKVKTFHRIDKEYQNALQQLSHKFKIINIAYEDINVNEYKGKFVKQNTKEEKMNLIDNMSEVLESWRKYD